MKWIILTTLTHWDGVTHTCVNDLTIIASDNGLVPGQRQAIIWTNAGILLTGPLGTNFSEILFKIHTFSYKKICLQILSGKWRPFCLRLIVLIVPELSSKLIFPQLNYWSCYTAEFYYNTVNFFENIHHRHPITVTYGASSVNSKIGLFSMFVYMQYHVISFNPENLFLFKFDFIF